MPAAFRYLCSCCGEHHVGMPALTFQEPAYWNDEVAADKSNHLCVDGCIIGEHFFIRSVLEVPIDGADDVLSWGVWVSQSRANYEEYMARLGDTPERMTTGYLAHRLPLYPDTLNLPMYVHWQTSGRRPILEPAASDHPLQDDWSKGITPERAAEFGALLHHPGEANIVPANQGWTRRARRWFSGL